MATSFEELSDSPRLTITDREVLGVRTFLVDWADRIAFAKELWGYWLTIGADGTGLLPASFPGLGNCFVTRVEIEPFDGKPTAQSFFNLVSDHNSYAKAKVTAHYRPLPAAEDNSNKPSVPAGTFLTLSIDVAGEFVVLPSRYFKWSSDNAKLRDDASPGVYLGTSEIQLTWSRVPRPPWSSLRDLIGDVNSSTFMGYSAGTVLYMGARVRRDFQINENTLWTVEHSFKARSQPWNYAFREDANAWALFVDGAGTKQYAESDFSPLFAFGS